MCGIIEVRNIGCDAAGLRGSFFLSGKCKINFIDNIASQYRVRCCWFCVGFYGLSSKEIRGGCPLISQS